MNRHQPYRPLLSQPPADSIRVDTCDTRRFPIAPSATPCSVQPLKGLRENHTHVLSYRALVPAGAGSVHWKRTTTEQHLRGRRWLHTSPTAHYSLLTANSLTYTFSAKEKDSETGLSYFGSRYYSSDLSVWLSVDPMAAKYPSLSPYVYCANNPVKLVDPDGEDYEVVVVGNTITIKATYYTHPDNYNRVEQGVQAWNSQSGLYEYTTDDGKTYSVNFELKVVKRNSLNDVKDSQGSWNWVNTEDFKGAVRGDSDGHNISLDIDISNAPVRTVIHEIGHTLGIADDAYGVMESGGDSDFILDEHIMTILKGAKIQSTNGSSNNSNCDCTQKEGVNCVYENNQMSGSFRRKGL